MTDRIEDRRKTKGPDASWPDDRLVGACLSNNEAAWNALVDKYSQMVFTVVRCYGVPNDQVTDIFQAIWLDAYSDLGQLRQARAFRAWLTSLARNKCYHWKQAWRRRQTHEIAHIDGAVPELPADDQPDLVEQLARDQLVREAILRLSPRCRELVRLLFFTFPPKPYKEIAASLGLATGSIGFTRGRCLKLLQKQLARDTFS